MTYAPKPLVYWETEHLTPDITCAVLNSRWLFHGHVPTQTQEGLYRGNPHSKLASLVIGARRIIVRVRGGCQTNVESGRRTMAVYKLPKLRTWVRFPSPAPELTISQLTLYGNLP